MNSGYNIYQSAVGSDASTVEAHINTTFFRREFFNLGELEVPSEDGEVSKLLENKSVAGGDLQILGATISESPQMMQTAQLMHVLGLETLARMHSKK